MLFGCKSGIKDKYNSICTISHGEMLIEYNLFSDDLKKNVSYLLLKMELPYEYFGIIDKNNITDESVSLIKDKIKKEFSDIDSFDIEFDYTIKIKLIVKNSKEITPYISDFDKILTFDEAIESLEKKGARCVNN